MHWSMVKHSLYQKITTATMTIFRNFRQYPCYYGCFNASLISKRRLPCWIMFTGLKCVLEWSKLSVATWSNIMRFKCTHSDAFDRWSNIPCSRKSHLRQWQFFGIFDNVHCDYDCFNAHYLAKRRLPCWVMFTGLKCVLNAASYLSLPEQYYEI